MRRSLLLILPIIVMAKAILAMPLPGDEVGEQISAYRQKVQDLLLQSEIVINEVYEELPELQIEFDNYLIMLSDFKSESSNKAALSKDMLNSWFRLLAMINDEIAKNHGEATTTQNYSKESSSEELYTYGKGEEESISEEETNTTEMSTSKEETSTTDELLAGEETTKTEGQFEDSSSEEDTPKETTTNTTDESSSEEEIPIRFLEKESSTTTTDDSSSEEEIPMRFEEKESTTTTTDESSSEEEIPIRFEENESSTTTTDVSSSEEEIPMRFEEIESTTTTNDESSSEEEIPMRFEENESSTTTTDESSSEEEIPMRFEEKESSTATTDESSSEEEIPMRFEEEESTTATTDESSSEEELPMHFEENQSTTTTTEASASKNEITTEQSKLMQMSQKIRYLDRILHDLKYNSMMLDDSEKGLVLLNKMMKWDEKYESDTFNEELLALSVGTDLKNDEKSMLLIEYRRLNNMYMLMLKSDKSNEMQNRIQLLKKYLNAFIFDTE